MKTARRSIRLMLVSIGLAAMGLALTGSSFGQDAEKSAAETAREEAKQRRAKLPFAKGTLDSIDLLRHQLKLRTEDGVRTFNYTADAYVFRGKEKISPDGLKTGETIAVRFVTDADGQALVRRVKAYGTTPSTGTEPSGPTESAK